MSLLARLASAPLSALSSLSEFLPPLTYTLSARTPRRARASLPEPWKCPAITQLRSTDTSGLELSQLGPDASPITPPHSKTLSPSVRPKVISKGKPKVQVAAIHGQCNDLVSNEVMFGSTARALCNGSASVRPNNFPYQLFENNDCCLKEKNECGPNTESDPRIKTLDRNSTGYASSISYLRPTIPAAPSMPNLYGHQSQKLDNDFCFSGKERQ